MDRNNPSQRNFYSPFRKIKTGWVYAKAIWKEVKNKKTYFKCYKNNLSGIIELEDGLKIEIEGRRSLQFLNSIMFNKMYGMPHQQEIIVDIGANKGLFAIFFANQLRGKDLKIYCFEPHPNTYRILQNNVQLNNLGSNISISQKVVSAERVANKSFFIARDSFDYSVFNEYESEENIIVENITLPSIIDENKIDKIDLLKMNCEGSEYEILMNIPDSYLRKISEIRMEFHNFELDGRIFNIEPLRAFLKEKKFVEVNYLPYTSDHGIIWFKNQK